MANTSRPASAARRAVISAPERIAASTTRVPSASPATMRLRAGNCQARATVPGGYSLTTAPASAIRWQSPRLRAG